MYATSSACSRKLIGTRPAPSRHAEEHREQPGRVVRHDRDPLADRRRRAPRARRPERGRAAAARARRSVPRATARAGRVRRRCRPGRRRRARPARCGHGWSAAPSWSPPVGRRGARPSGGGPQRPTLRHARPGTRHWTGLPRRRRVPGRRGARSGHRTRSPGAGRSGAGDSGGCGATTRPTPMGETGHSGDGPDTTFAPRTMTVMSRRLLMRSTAIVAWPRTGSLQALGSRTCHHAEPSAAPLSWGAITRLPGW